MITAVDTNILLDVLIPDAPYGAASQQSLDAALQQGTLVLNEVVYAELAAHFPTQEGLGTVSGRHYYAPGTISASSPGSCWASMGCLYPPAWAKVSLLCMRSGSAALLSAVWGCTP
jgi:hypothetical protein